MSEPIMSREIINTYDQLVAAGGGIAICYRRQDPGRAGHGAAWQVLHVDASGNVIPTDPKTHWTNRGLKTFDTPFRVAVTRPRELINAIEWVKDKYGETGLWTRNLFGDYVPMRINIMFPIRKRYR